MLLIGSFFIYFTGLVLPHTTSMSERATKFIKAEGTTSVPSHENKNVEGTSVGPFSLLEGSIRDGYRVFIQCRSNKSLLGSVVAFDKHFNLVLRNVREISGSEGGADIAPRHIKNMFLRGESVIFIVKLANEE